jgi:hypothetical protein
LGRFGKIGPATEVLLRGVGIRVSRVLLTDFSVQTESAYASSPWAKDEMTKAPKGWDKIDNGRRKRPVRKGRPSSPPGKRRLLVTEKTGPEILSIIENWPLDENLEWKPLMALLGKRYGGTWTRQAVSKHEFLQDAFTKKQEEILEYRRKKANEAGKRVARTRDEEVAYLKQQLQATNQEITDLKVQLGIVEDRMARWRHNALNHMTFRQLDEKLQENDRRRSDR